MYDINDIGKRITSLRKSMSMTQEELASKLNITAQAVSKWENRLSLPDISILPELARALNTTIDKIFGNEVTSSIRKMYEAKFPEYMDETGKKLKLVHTLGRVGCYSEKEVSIVNGDTVIFTDGSSANLKTLKIINKVQGEICFDYNDMIPEVDYNIDLTKTELHEEFDDILSVKVDIMYSGEYEIVKSKDNKTYVDAFGTPIFINSLMVKKDGKLLSVKIENHNNNSNNSNKGNKVRIALGREEGEEIIPLVNGSGNCNIKIPFKKGSILINGSGKVSFGTIIDADCSINGSGDINCDKVRNLKVSINGSGDVFIKRACEIDTLEARISGSGDVIARNVCTKTAVLSTQGSGDIVVGRVK